MKVNSFSSLIFFTLIGICLGSSGCIDIGLGGPSCPAPNVTINGTCCLDEDLNQICDLDETTSTTTSTSTSTTTTTSTTSTSTSSTTTSLECFNHSDCGEEYFYEKYLCHNGNVARIKYLPRCINWECITKSERNVIEICDINERCISGRDRCFNEEEYRKPAGSILLNISKKEFTGGYREYRFKLLNYTTRRRSNEILYAEIEVEFPDESTETVRCSWDYSDEAGDVEIGLFSEKYVKNENKATIWVR